ncbi:hypothetical protein AV530_012759 [Patagioenas fasciata monilis]|uniref:LRAT domain-containing protein n=1 Tax=Patagioenas fasciata monilis TaxID=372326 RepID=A0A1V4JSW9_PATFA|nr:hypothetical protein AV530_012759 [Patagioenas fasciata monilis]
MIQFRRTGTQSSSGLTSSLTAPALVTKEGLGTMKKKWGKFKIYHKTDGVALSDFRNNVRKAMNNDAEYDFMENNCIYFALSLLGLEKFYSQLVQIQDEGGSSRGSRRAGNVRSQILGTESFSGLPRTSKATQPSGAWEQPHSVP